MIPRRPKGAVAGPLLVERRSSQGLARHRPWKDFPSLAFSARLFRNSCVRNPIPANWSGGNGRYFKWLPFLNAFRTLCSRQRRNSGEFRTRFERRDSRFSVRVARSVAYRRNHSDVADMRLTEIQGNMTFVAFSGSGKSRGSRAPTACHRVCGHGGIFDFLARGRRRSELCSDAESGPFDDWSGP